MTLALRPSRAGSQDLPGERPSPGRNLGLDLVRAMALLLVLLSHGSNVFLSFWGRQPPDFVALSGVFGVELFFVLSGFLIGTLLSHAAASAPGWRGWRVFMARRWLRTLPLYVAWIAITAVLWPPAEGRLAWHLMRYLTLTQNLAWRMPHDNWFGVSWSLAIEEWFYLLFSLPLLLLATRDRGRVSLPLLTALFILVPVAIRSLLPTGLDFGQAVYKVTAYRLDAIAYGVAASLAATRLPGLLRPWRVLLACGLAVVAFIWVEIAGAGLGLPAVFFRSLFLPLLAFGYCLVLPAVLRLREAPAWFRGPVRWLSTRSYGLYVVHLTILEAVSWGVFVNHWSRAGMLVLAATACPVLAELSWRLIERPALRIRPTQPGGRTVISVSHSSSVAIASDMPTLR